MRRSLLVFTLAWAVGAIAYAQEPRQLRIGIIGCDTSHAIAFTQIFHDPKLDAASEPDLANCKVVAAFPGGSPDLPVSRDRVAKFTAELRDKLNIEIVDSIDALLPKVDAVLLLSVDGRIHLKQAAAVFKARKPVYVDKPLAASLADAIAIVDMAKESKTPLMSCSSLRYGKGVDAIKSDPKIGTVLGCLTYGPGTYAPHHPDLAFYGIHGLELLYALMGPGCESITRVHTKDTDVLTGTWKDGRVATYRGIRSEKADFGATVFGANGVVHAQPYDGYKPMLREVAKFFRTGTSPISPEEMIEVIAVIEAADLSKTNGGGPVSIAEVIKATRPSPRP